MNLSQVLDTITIDMLNSISYGEDIELSDKYTLYHYSENDVIVVNLTDEWEEIVQVLSNDNQVIFEVINKRLFNKENK